MSSFWSEASALTKGAVVLFVVGVLYLAVAYFAKVPPFMADDTTMQRGIDAP